MSVLVGDVLPVGLALLAGEAEVDQLNPSVRGLVERHHHVLRFQVFMDVIGLVEVLYHAEHGMPELTDSAERERVAAHLLQVS